MLKVNHIDAYYGKVQVLHDVSLEVGENEIISLIGANGAGKSTAIRTLLGLISPTSGNARIFDKDIIHGCIDILSRIGYMPSEAMFYHGMK